MLRKLRSVVDRYTASHRDLVRELLQMRRYYATVELAKEQELTPEQRFLLEGGPVPAPKPANPNKGGKKFEMWISLKVGLTRTPALTLPLTRSLSLTP